MFHRVESMFGTGITFTFFGLALGLACIVMPCGCSAKEAPSEIRVALFSKHNLRAKNQLRAALLEADDIRTTIVNDSEMQNGCLKDFDVLVMPGGSGKGETLKVSARGREEVRRFVGEGGAYLGVCAGFYFLTDGMSKNLKMLPLSTLDREHWRRGIATLSIEFTRLGMEIFGVRDRQAAVLYHNGPVLCENSQLGWPNVIPLSYFRDEVVAPGGDQGVMIGAPAMVLGFYGSGLVIGISPHPEASPGLEDVEVNAVRWLSAHKGHKFSFEQSSSTRYSRPLHLSLSRDRASK